MHRFDYSEILGDIPSDIVRLMMDITKIRSMENIRHLNYAKDYEHLENIAKIASVKYSNAIEGIYTSDDRIREIVLRNSKPLTHSEKEIAGYTKALNEIHTNNQGLKFDKETIIRIHSYLDTKDSDKMAYKDRDNAIVSIDPLGNRHLIYEPVSAEQTEWHMEQLCLAYSELSTQGYDPLLYIPCVILDFLSIHPFIDGNGRASRLLTILLLYKEGIDVCRYVSMDEHISFTRDDYYHSLELSSTGWKENRWTYFPFIRYFLRTLLECYTDLDTRFGIVDGRRMKKSDSVENVIKNSLAPVSKRQICMILKDVSPHTVEKTLKNLLSEGRIERIGETKSARYIYKGDR